MQAMVDKHAYDQGYRHLIVLTLSEKADSFAYRQTRAFYKRMGFTPLFQSDTIWDGGNPAEILIKRLDEKSVRKKPEIFLEINRLRIRPYEKGDLMAFHRIFSDEEVIKACEEIYTESKSETVLRQFIDSRIAYAVKHKEDAIMIASSFSSRFLQVMRGSKRLAGSSIRHIGTKVMLLKLPTRC